MGTVININKITERFSTQKEFKRIDPFKFDFCKLLGDDTYLMQIIKKYRKFSGRNKDETLEEIQQRVLMVPALWSLTNDKTNKQ